MNKRKVIGWLVFSLGVPLFFIIVPVSKILTGNYMLGTFIGVLVIASGWILAHPKRNNE